jgi:hypothetical protein
MTENRHGARARDYLGKGDAYYGKAADEIIAWQREDPTLGYGRIASVVGRSEAWCRTLVKWRTNPSSSAITPYGGKDVAVQQDTAKTKRVLRTATADQLKQVMGDLPSEQVEAIQAVAHDVAWEQADAAHAEQSELTSTGAAKQREARQRGARHRLTVLDVKIAADQGRARLRRMIELLAEVELTSDERHEVSWRVDEMTQALEIVKAALGSGNWDAALAELQP